MRAQRRATEGRRPEEAESSLGAEEGGRHSVREICEIVSISRNTYYSITISTRGQTTSRAAPRIARRHPQTWDPPNVMKVKLWLRVKTTSKYVRGKGKARDEIERQVLNLFGMEELDKEGSAYILSIPYTTDEELDRFIYDEIWREADRIADARHCFTEGDMTALEHPDRHWRAWRLPFLPALSPTL